jgi:hypothetical protein
MDGLYNDGQTGDADIIYKNEAAPAAVVEEEKQANQAMPIVVIQQPPQPMVTVNTVTQQQQPGGVIPSKVSSINTNLEENLSPWIGNEAFYGFYCQTNWDDLLAKAKDRKNKEKRLEFERHPVRSISVYHKKKSDRLIIKSRASANVLIKIDSGGMLFKIAAAVCCLGVLLLAIGAWIDEIALIVIGALMLVGGIFIIICSGKQKAKMTASQFVTQMIPINSIKFVEREALQIKLQQKCCSKDDERDPEFNTSEINIGFERCNVSSKLMAGSGSSEDFVQMVLAANDAFNLHQYLNYVVDG